MNEVQITEREYGVITGFMDLFDAKAAEGSSPDPQPSRTVPDWLPSGDEVKTVQQAAILMGVTEKIAARYVIEQKSEGDLYDSALSQLRQND